MDCRRLRSNQLRYISSREIPRELLLSAARAVIRVLPRTKALSLFIEIKSCIRQ